MLVDEDPANELQTAATVCILDVRDEKRKNISQQNDQNKAQQFFLQINYNLAFEFKESTT